MAMTQALIKNSKLDDLFRVIQSPIYNSLIKRNISNSEIINCIDLNMINLKKYYPMISSILKENDYYKEDLLYDFMEIRMMSMHILENLEKLTNELFTDFNPFLENIHDNLLFIDRILDDFHQILRIKNEYIQKNLSSQEYDIAYNRYKLKLENDSKIFYEKFYKNTNESKYEDLVKEIMSMEFIKNEFR